MTRDPVLADTDRDRELATGGYTSLPMIGAEVVARLRSAYWARASPGETGLAIDLLRKERDAARAATALLAPVFEEHLAHLFVDQRLIMASFLVKHPGGDESAMYLHDDRSYVDEPNQRSTTIWIPLVDVGPGIDNGGVAVVPRSHLLPTGLSGSFTPDLVRPYERHLRHNLVQPHVPAGHGLVYDSRTLHASGPNTSGVVREAIGLAVAPRSAPLLHVVATGRRHRRVHRIDEAFFVELHVREIERGIPERYPVVAELDEDRDLRPEQVAAVLGGDVPLVQAVVPNDLVEHGATWDRPEPQWHPVPAPTVAVDLELTASDLDGAPGPRTGAVLVVHGGSGAIVSAAGGPPAVQDAVARAQAPRRAMVTDLIVLDPGTRAELTVPARSAWLWHLGVAEAPTVAAGVRTGGATMNLRPDRRVALVGGPSLLWNDGPGPLALLVSRSPVSPVAAATGVVGTLRALRARDRVTDAVRGAAESAQRGVGAVLAADERLVNRHAPAIDGPLDPLTPPWAAHLIAGWADIRAELDDLVAADVRLPETDDLVGTAQGAEGSWTTYLLSWYGRQIAESTRRCPQTAALLAEVPGVQVAGYTVLGPHTHIPRHQGPAKSFRWQMGIRVPGPPGSSRLQIGDEVVPWEDRRCLAFDDRTPHEAWNDSDQARYILFVQVPWPLAGWPGIVHRSTQRAFGLANRRVAHRAGEIDTTLNPGR